MSVSKLSIHYSTPSISNTYQREHFCHVLAPVGKKGWNSEIGVQESVSLKENK